MKNKKILWNVLLRVWRTYRGIEAASFREACQHALAQAPPRAIVMECWKDGDGRWNVTVRGLVTVRNVEAMDRTEACMEALKSVDGNGVVESCWKLVDEMKFREAHRPAKPAA